MAFSNDGWFASTARRKSALCSFSAGAHLDHADHASAAQSLDEMVDLTVESGSAGPLAINLHRSVLGHDAVKEVVQVVGLCCPAQRVGTGRCLPEIQVASKQVKVRAGPIGGCIPSAASSD